MNPFEKSKKPKRYDEIKEEILAKIKKAASKVRYKNKLETAIRREKSRIVVAYEGIKRNLERALSVLDAYENAHVFYKELINIIFKEEILKETRENLKKCLYILAKIKDNYLKKIEKIKNPKDGTEIRRESLGRLLSVIRRKRKYLDVVVELWRYAHKLPSIDFNEPIVVIAGPPNVGKSSLVNILSTAKSKVASYPFTTKEIHIGHMEANHYRIQVVDTPGLLDRPLSERNEIELKAIVALRHLPNLVVFMFDVSPSRYYDIEKQIKIFRDVKNLFHNKACIVVVNKIDQEEEDITNYLINAGIEFFRTSLVNNIGVDSLKDAIIKSVQQEYLKKIEGRSES
ncbi:MAG: GTPase [Candidatus Geothermarchaeota archaeon]